jgi:hypothetical protein
VGPTAAAAAGPTYQFREEPTFSHFHFEKRKEKEEEGAI